MKKVLCGIGGFFVVAGFMVMVGASGSLGFALMLVGSLFLLPLIPKKTKH